MHVPAGNTKDLSVQPFRQALLQALAPQSEYDEKAWLYVPCRYEEYRYILGTTGEKPLICIGVNPSTARPGALDNTLKSVQRIARFNGYDSFVMFNLYAQRATDPDAMEKEFNPVLHRENLEAFSYVLSHAGPSPAVWAAWGAVIEKRAYLYDCAAGLYAVGKSFSARWYTCGKRSLRGHPHHPLYLPKDALLEPFEPEEYVAACKEAFLKKTAEKKSAGASF